MHPNGEEVICLLSGEVEFVLELDEGPLNVALRTPGDYCIVPRGIWHTGRTNTAARMLYVTPGEGTEHRPG
jgi:oxalate decarboxylase/phosphoglucose isomerase-like protein (cupin superfamily)